MNEPNPETTPHAVLKCPKCGVDTRVPESLFGKGVRCPECKTDFIAPKRRKDGTLGAPLLPGDLAKVVTFRNSPLLVAGLMLLMAGLQYLIVNGMILYNTAYRPAEFVEAVKRNLSDPKNEMRQVLEKSGGFNVEDLNEGDLVRLRNLSYVCFAGGLLVTAAGVAVLSRRFHKLAIAGSVISIVNINMMCCFFGAPVGVFALVKLFDPDSRKLFR